MVSDYDDLIKRRTPIKYLRAKVKYNVTYYGDLLNRDTVGSGLSFHATTWERVNFVVIVSGVLDRKEETDYAVEEIDQSFHKMMRVRAKFFGENGVDLKMAAEEINLSFHEMRWVTVNFSVGDFETRAAAVTNEDNHKKTSWMAKGSNFVEMDDRGRHIISPPGGLLRLFGLAVWNGWWG